MEYRQNDWSILGFGCMRFPKKGGSVDMKETERELAYAIAHGVNYFDTAYIYRGNEKVLGELVAKNHWRAQIQIATKMPHYLIHSIDELEKLFCEQLKRLQTDYVDESITIPDRNVEEARALLESAGYTLDADGYYLHATLDGFESGNFSDIAQIVKANLAEAGIDISHI